MAENPTEITTLLLAHAAGDSAALERLLPRVYDELRRMARQRLRHERTDHTLSATDLVHEAFLKLVGLDQVDWQNRAHFFAIAAQMMRRILVDNARRERRPKHGSGDRGAPLDDAVAAAPPPEVDQVDALALDAALTKLEALDPDQARIVELRFFGGLTIEEAAEVMRVSPATIKREWAIAKGWLYRELGGELGGG